MPMRVFMSKRPISAFLFINFVFCKHLVVVAVVVAQPPIYPYDQALLPFGSQPTAGRLLSHCDRRRFSSESVFTVLNNCLYTVWAAAVPGGGRRLNSGQAWTFSLPAGTVGRIWGRTNCSFDGSSGRGKCLTGDCGGLLECQNFGVPPNTLAEFLLNTYNNLDFYDVSLVNGFNIPIQFRPTSNGCSRSINCAADIIGQCPSELRAPGGCNNPCAVFQTREYCCTDSSSCGPTEYSKFFKERCPNVYSYPLDDKSNAFACPAGTNYDVVFCPSTQLTY